MPSDAAALVGARREHATPAAAASQVQDREHVRDEGGEREQRVPRRVRERIQAEARHAAAGGR
jgi:hypothetical protein